MEDRYKVLEFLVKEMMHAKEQDPNVGQKVRVQYNQDIEDSTSQKRRLAKDRKNNYTQQQAKYYKKEQVNLQHIERSRSNIETYNVKNKAQQQNGKEISIDVEHLDQNMQDLGRSRSKTSKIKNQSQLDVDGSIDMNEMVTSR